MKIKFNNTFQIIFGVIIISFYSCGFPQIAKFPDFEYSREEYQNALQVLWERHPENKVKYDEILIYTSALKKDENLIGYVNEIEIDSLSNEDVEKKFFHNENTDYYFMKNTWILKSEDDSLWYIISLLYKLREKPTDCILSISNIKYNDSKFRLENFETLDVNERLRISMKFENEILKKLINIIESKDYTERLNIEA